MERGERHIQDVYAQVFVKSKQSVYLKVPLRPAAHRPLARRRRPQPAPHPHPVVGQHHLTQGVRPTSNGGVPRSFVSRLVREARLDRAPKRSGTQSRWGVYYGQIKLHGVPRLAFVARPPRVPVTERDVLDGRKGASALDQVLVTKGGEVRRVGRKLKDTDHPRILFLAVDRATYRPSLQQPWDEACRAAAARIPTIMEAQLADNIFHKMTRNMV